MSDIRMNGPGSTGNVIAALASFFIPGLGQLAQGRWLAAALFFVLTPIAWILSCCTLGWVVHLWSVVDAARWQRTS